VDEAPQMTKMSFKAHEPMWTSFNDTFRKLPINRDPFLNQVLKMETPRLRQAMEGKRLSGKANRWVSTQHNRHRPTPINVGVEKTVAAELNDVIEKSNLVRDAVFNRIIAFLRSSNFLLDYFELPHTENGTVGKGYADISKPVSPISSLWDIINDPLWYLHMAVEEIHGTSLYLLPFPSPKMDGFNCWMDDEQVPETRKFKKHQKEMEEIERSIMEFESDAFLPKTKE
jgi:hypothetical protein